MSRRWDGAQISLMIMCTLLVVPYLTPTDGQLLFVRKFVSIGDHILYSSAICTLIVSSFAFGRTIARRVVRFDPTSVNHVPWFSILVALILSQVVAYALIAWSGLAYMDGGFLAAREVVDFQGTGIIVRFYLIALPLIAVSGVTRRTTVILLMVCGVSAALRAFILSERLAVAEFVVTAFICVSWKRIKVNKAYLAAGLTASVIFFSVVQQNRLEQQNLSTSLWSGGIIENVASTLSVYYADAQNKVYLALEGYLEYPTVFALSPIFAFSGESFNSNDFLTQMWSRANFIVPALNNTAGLAEDLSDFGPFFGFIWCAFKFFMIGYMTWNARYRILSIALYPLLLIQVLEYPRFNYLELPFGAYLMVIATGVGITFHGKALRSRAEG